jgi:hypothetical protein
MRLAQKGIVWLLSSALCLVSSRPALAVDVVIAEAVADDEGTGSLCIASTKISPDELGMLISSQMKIDGQMTSVDTTGANAKIGFRSTPASHVSGRFPSEVVQANGLHQCAAGVLGAYQPAAIGGLLALGGIFGGLCAAGDLGCGSSSSSSSPGTTTPIPGPRQTPTPRPTRVPNQTPTPVSPFH